jgi:hypothetical protein
MTYDASVESYPTAKDKLALLIESTSIAKSVLIVDKGIGEDLPPTLVGWDDDAFTVIIQADEQVAKRPRTYRLRTLNTCALALRDGWYPDSFTYIGEGYCQLETDDIETRPLDEAFVDNPTVSECLTFLHVTSDTSLAVVLPYKQLVGRHVEYGTITRINSTSFTPEIETLQRALNAEPPLPTTTYTQHLNEITHHIQRTGWQLVHNL